MKTSKFRSTVKIPKLQPAFPVRMSKTEKGKQEQMTEETWSKHGHKQEAIFKKADERGDVEAMHRLWTKAAVGAIRELTETEVMGKHKKTKEEQKLLQLFIHHIHLKILYFYHHQRYKVRCMLSQCNDLGALD